MIMRAARWSPLPLYLAACPVLGGSSNGLWTNLLLQLGAVMILAITLAQPRRERAPRRARHLVLLALAGVALIVAQLVPLPPALWSALPGRGFVADGLAMIGQTPGWLPLSLEPASTLDSACFLLPPFAVLLWVVRGGALPMRSVVLILLGAGLAGAMLGLRQISTGDLALFPYPFSSWGKAPGFFANSAHMALLMLVSIPFLTALVIDVSKGERSRTVAIGVAALAVAVILFALIALNTSAAVLLLTAPVMFMSVALWGGRGAAWLRKLAVPLIFAAIAGGLLLTYLSGRSQAANETSYATRSVIWSHTSQALGGYNFAGSGFGTFAHAYRRFEPLETLDLTFVNHAHNDYLELAVEGGLPAMLLIALFLLWWGRAAWAAWRGPHENVYVRAATIASGAMLIHEMVEFPLRSPALAVLFALCIGLMAVVSVLPVRKRDGDLWSARHLSID